MNNETIAVILNGPPNSGKDTIAELMVKIFEDNGREAVHKEFKEKLFELTKTIYGVDDDTFFTIYNDRSQKEVRQTIFNNLSIRQAMINVSEVIIKPNFGQNYFGQAAANKIEIGKINVYSDGGFAPEVAELAAVCDKVLIVAIKRKGTSFSIDSRNYLSESNNDYDNVSFVTLHNNYNGVDELESELEGILEWYEIIIENTPLDKGPKHEEKIAWIKGMEG